MSLKLALFSITARGIFCVIFCLSVTNIASIFPEVRAINFSGGVWVVMMIWVVPVFKEVFGHFQAELPAPTKILISISTVIQNYFLEILLSALVMVAR
jgi:type II secretory pathway component PulF